MFVLTKKGSSRGLLIACMMGLWPDKVNPYQINSTQLDEEPRDAEESFDS